MSRVQTIPNFYGQQKDLAARVQSLERAINQIALQPGDIIGSGASTRIGCLKCDGTSHSSSQFPSLAAALGATGLTFTVPNLTGAPFSVVNWFIKT